MVKLAANLSMMFTEVAMPARFAAAATAGFRGVEMLFPYEWPADLLAAELSRHGLTQALFNLPPGDWAAGERGTASLPGREAEFLAGVESARLYARSLGCRTLHCMAGMRQPGLGLVEQTEIYLANLARAAALLAEDGLTLVIEPINARDMPGYLLSRQDRALDVVDAVGAANLKLQLDLYHCQITEGDLARRIEASFDRIGHVQIAGVPERHEPDTGEVAYPHLLGLLDRLGYAGWVGCEYRPRGRTEDGLGWLRAWAPPGDGPSGRA